MTTFRNYWFRFGGALLIILGLVLAITRPNLAKIQWLLIFNLMALFAHQFEEYQLPGGAPLVINRVIYNEHTLTDRYPGNTLSIMLVNTSAWLIYVAAIFLPNLYWFGLGVILFSLFQILGHCFQMNLKLHTWYNPGMLTTLVLFLPIGYQYIQLVTVQSLVTGKDWLFATLTLLACVIVTIVLPVQTLKNKQTKYRMSAWQIKQFQAVLNFAHVGHSKIK